MSAAREPRRTRSPRRPPALGIARARAASWSCAAWSPPSPAPSSRSSAGTAVVMLTGLPVETIGTPVRRHPVRTSLAAHPAVRRRAHPDFAPAGAHGGDARRDRVADVRRRRRPDGRRPAQSERRAGRAGHREHRVADLRRPAGHRRHRPDGDQHPLRRTDARSPGWCTRSRCWSCCSSPRRSPATSRWRCSAAILFVVSYNMGEWHEIPKLLGSRKTDISVWLVTFALTVFADLTRRRRGRDDPRGAALHPAGRGDDHRVAR